MLQLLKIQCTLKLRTRSLSFLCMEASVLLDTIISLMPFLAELILPKKPLTTNFRPIPKSTNLALVLPPIPIYLDSWPEKRFILWHWKLRIIMTVSQSSDYLLMLMNFLVFVIKCLLSLIQISSPLQISWNLLFVNPVNHLVQSPIRLNSMNQQRLNKIKRKFFLEMAMILVISSLLTNILSTHQAIKLWQRSTFTVGHFWCCCYWSYLDQETSLTWSWRYFDG